ncbi:MAG: RNA polymerase factor sigma-54 [Rhizobiaceae bacterium]
MALSAKLQVRQSQSLVMTPQLMQSIRILQFSHAELQQFVEQEVERNPLLELIPSGIETDPMRRTGDQQEAAGDTGREREREISDELETSGAVLEDNLGTALDNVYDREPGEMAGPLSGGGFDSLRGGSAGSSEDFDRVAQIASQLPTLREHLSAQIGTEHCTAAQKLLAEEIAGSLDNDGYLRRPLGDIAASLGASETQVQDALKIVQGLDPSGVGARDLAECLAIQLKEADRFDPAMEALVANLDLLARRDFQALTRLCGVDGEDLGEMVQELRSLNPRPGSAFETEAVRAVAPDVLVSARPDGSWAIELNSETLPKVLVNRTYFATVKGSCRNDTEKEFLVDCLQTANWLTKSLDQRAQTILKVAGEIVRQQDLFLAHGIAHLRPLNLRTVADAIKMHESTVSRVTSNKYMMTPRGLFEMKYFFTSGVSSVEGDEGHSAEAVKHRIRQLVAEEAPDAILSDDTLVDMLKSEGIDIARRTVAKYREALKIASSVQRRREKRMMRVR